MSSASSMQQFFRPAPSFRPQLNVGCLFDIPTGRYHMGRHGQMVLNGGLAFFTGFGGRGNTFKSTIMHFMIMRSFSRFAKSNAMIYDTEMSLTVDRLYQLSAKFPEIQGQDLEANGRLMVIDSTSMIGEVFFKALTDYGAQRIKDAKSHMMTTPFIDKKTGALFQAIYPSMSEIDSLSMFTTTSVGNIYEKNKIGDSGANTDSLRGSAAKSQMLMQIPTLTASASIYLATSAHVGNQHQLDPYSPPARQLAFLKGKNAFKHVPEKFTFLPNNLYYAHGAQVLANKGTKAPEYPKSSQDNMEGDTDLQLIQIQNLRAKAGPTGMPYEVIVSQREGVLVGLTEFNYIKSFDRFGLGGNDRNYFLDLLPDVSLSRTTVRGKIEENEELRRALEISSEMAQIMFVGYQTASMPDDKPGEEQKRTTELACTPKELYEDLKAKGYDWKVLLDTRGYWVPEEEEGDHKPFLSTLDLLRMRAGQYHPYWLPALSSK